MDVTVAYLRSLGHHNNPLISSMFAGKSEEWWHRLKRDSPEGLALVASFQMMMGEDHEELVRKHHNRAAVYDGEIGPATTELFTVPRCACPDYMAQNELEATGRGSWSPGCLGNSDRHEVKFHVDFNRCPYVEWWPGVQEAVIAAYAEIGMALVRTENRSEAHIHVQFEVLAGSTIGLAQLPGSGHCRRGYFCKLDPGYRPNANQIMQLWAHELGHNMNSGHISGDPIMHPSMRNQTWNKTFRGTAFGSRLSGYFGGEPLDPPKPPPKPPTGSGGILVIEGTQGFLRIANRGDAPVTLEPNEVFPKKYIVTPSPF